jgi:cadmium resistance transport/sequestration family protein
MNWFFGAIVTGITAFTATNIDDLVILMLFFAQVDSKLKPWHIFAGQYLGFTALVLTSLPGFFGGLMIPRPWIGLMGFVPIFIGINHLINPEDDDEEVQGISTDFAVKENSSTLLAKLSHLMKPQIFQVGAVTFANGGDNIGIYVPLFASSNLPSFLTILIVFYIMIGVWCYSAYQFTRHPQVAKLLTRYTHAIVPFVLIGLGLFILWESKSYQLLGVKI